MKIFGDVSGRFFFFSEVSKRGWQEGVGDQQRPPKNTAKIAPRTVLSISKGGIGKRVQNKARIYGMGGISLLTISCIELIFSGVASFCRRAPRTFLLFPSCVLALACGHRHPLKVKAKSPNTESLYLLAEEGPASRGRRLLSW